MQHRLPLLCAAALTAAAALAALWCAVAPARADLPPYAKVITLVVVAPLSGADRQAGLDLSAGVSAAVDDANEMRGLADFGYAIQTFDDQNDPGIAQQQAQFALVSPNSTFIIGHLGGQATLLSLPTYHQAEIPVIVPTAPLAAITRQNYDNIFRLCPSDVEEGIQDARYAERSLRAKRIAVVYEEDDYGVDAAQGFVNYVGAGKGTAEKDFSVPVDVKNAAATATGVKTFAPDLVFVAGNPSLMSKVVAAIRSAGVAAPLLATQSFSDASALKALGSNAEGLSFSSCMPPVNLMPTTMQFRIRYESRHGTLTPFSLFGYVAAQVAIAATRQARTADRLALDRQLAVSAFQTVIGPVSFGRNGDPSDPFVYIYSVQSGVPKYTGTASGIPNPLILK